MAVLPNTIQGTVTSTSPAPATTTQAAAASNPAAQVAAPATVSPNSAYGIQARQALNNMGVDNQRIGYNNGYVTVDGQNIFRPGANQNGTSYVNQAMLNSAQGQINQLNTQNRLTQQVVNPQAVVNPYDSQITQQLAALNNPVAANPYDNQIADVLAQLTQRINNPTPYDPYTSPEYAAQQAAAQRGAQQSTRAAQESLGASWFGRSSNLADRAQGIQNQANEYMQLQVIPQLISANQAQQQQGLANLSSLVSALSGQQGVYENRAQSDRSNQYNILQALMNQQGVNDTRSQNQFSNANTALQYLADQNQRGIDNTRNQRNDNLNAANIVSQLTGRVVNPQTDWTGLFRQASDSKTPLTADQQNTQFNQQYQLEQFAYSKARDAISDKQWQAKFDEDVRQNGLSYGLQQLSMDNDQAYRQAQLGLSQDDNARAWATLDYQQSKPAADKYTGMTASQLLDNIKPLYEEPVYTVDKLGKQVDTGKTQLTKDPAKLTELFETVVDAGLSDTETKQVLLSLGYTMKDIESRIKQYSGN